MSNESKKGKCKFKRNKKLDVIFHVDTGLVIKGDKDKTVINRIVDGKIIDLDDDALDLCDEFGLTPDPALFDEESEVESNEADNDEHNDKESVVDETVCDKVISTIEEFTEEVTDNDTSENEELRSDVKPVVDQVSPVVDQVLSPKQHALNEALSTSMTTLMSDIMSNVEIIYGANDRHNTARVLELESEVTTLQDQVSSLKKKLKCLMSQFADDL